MQKSEWILAAFLLLFVTGIGAFLFLAPQSSGGGTVTGPVDVGGGTIAIADQVDLHVAHVSTTLAAPGFVTIHEVLGGAPATIIGTSIYLAAGEYPDLKIALSTPMKPDYQYIGLLHADNGDRQFMVADDMPVKTDGKVVEVKFVTTKEAK